ncbi:spore coat protein CotD [Rossellomorea marisflavi]|uniref:CotD n=1 Tax=Rossellomorea marisflavi TaxID=189381 RepID=A0A0M0GQ87_9BACI|nr:CotD family spore coat protein [Rossellomorea marisflavi]KQU59825.1 spore coat protein CotD [Bacillus sp. Leaf406]MBV6683557.1 spore coat protein [Bacillus sp. JRC01]KON91586.1 CotD [Rossellomorea marisflavi]MCM2590702.1 spore coat protein [Rossellomorea marisflavi]MDW4527109.1 CotD family spore coat protein [Rossellomorea marisflavi]
MYCRPRPNQVLPAVMHPTKCCVNHTFTTLEVPHIHPVHTTTVNHVNYQHKHYFPHTNSMVDNVSNQQFNCGGGMGGPGGPGFGPGFGPRPRPFGF